MKDVIISRKSLVSVFCFLYHKSSPVMSPLKQLVGWAELGKFRGRDLWGF
jgi:hypothetical protein